LLCRAVKHPSEWDACGYNEFYKQKQRFRIININRLLQVLDILDIETFRKWHTLTLNSIIDRETSKYVELWTKAYAVGNQEWLEEKLKTAGIKRMKIKSTDGISFAIGGND
jgi:hypothetical protein